MKLTRTQHDLLMQASVTTDGRLTVRGPGDTRIAINLVKRGLVRVATQPLSANYDTHLFEITMKGRATLRAPMEIVSRTRTDTRQTRAGRKRSS